MKALRGVIQFFKEVRAELSKVVWPDQRETTAYTAVVLFSVAVIVGMFWLMDTMLAGGLRLLLGP